MPLFSKKPALYVRYPPPLKAEGWEFQFAQTYCRAYMEAGIKQVAHSVIWLDTDADLAKVPAQAMVLWWEDPLLLIAPQTLAKLMKGVQAGYSAVAPQLAQTDFLPQQAIPAFGIVNQATFEEHNASTVQPAWLEVEALDPTFGWFRAGALRKQFQAGQPVGKQAILADSLAFSFKASTGHLREDLLAMIPPGVREILDVGCANGALGRRWSQLHGEAAFDGLEPEATQAAEARSCYRQVWETSLEAFTPEASYDLIICGDVLEHLDDPWTQLGRVASWLRPGGYLLLSVPNAGHWSLVADQAQGRFSYLPWGLTCITHRRWFTEASMREALQRAGFAPVSWEQEQPLPSPRGEAFIQTLLNVQMGDEASLRTLQFRILAKKQV